MRESFSENTDIRTVPAGNLYFVKAKIDGKTGLVYQIDVETPDYAENCTESGYHH